MLIDAATASHSELALLRRRLVDAIIQQPKAPDTADAFSTELGCAGPRARVHSLSERAGVASTTGPAWSLPLRTDSVNRGFCISLFTLAMIFLAISIRFVFFFIIPKI
jgi:hypothetical protein